MILNMKNNKSKFNFDDENENKKDDYMNQKSFILLRQAVTTSTAVIPSFPAGYPDQFYPEPVSFAHRHPTKRMLFEAQMMDLIAPRFLQIKDVTVFSSFRRNATCTITQSDGNVIMLAQKIMAPLVHHLPFYKGNRTIIQNGFLVKLKNLDDGGGSCALTFTRKTLYNAYHTDWVNVWFGNQDAPMGKIKKRPLVNEYKIFGELGQPLFVIHKARSMTHPKDLKKNYKYVIHRVDKDKTIIGGITWKGRKLFGPGEYPCHTELPSDLCITHKALILGALFLIASRAHSGFEREEEKTREALEMDENYELR